MAMAGLVSGVEMNRLLDLQSVSVAGPVLQCRCPAPAHSRYTTTVEFSYYLEMSPAGQRHGTDFERYNID